MYAVIRTGGKQYRVEEGETLNVELLGEIGTSVDLAPVMLVDGDDVRATPDQLGQASVSAEIVDRVRGTKINAFTYKSKSNQRRRWGHRQNYNSIKITGISKG
jgi:large subunit ribosomal protein L21